MSATRMRKAGVTSRLYKTGLASALLLGLTVGAQAATQTAFEGTFSRKLESITGTTAGLSVPFPQIAFDATLGTLDAVYLNLDSELIEEGGATFETAFVRASRNRPSLGFSGGGFDELFRIEATSAGDFDFSIELMSTYGLSQSDFEPNSFGGLPISFGGPLTKQDATGSLTWEGFFSMTYDFTPAPVQDPLTPVPLPASALLLLGGIAGLGFMKRRKQVTT